MKTFLYSVKSSCGVVTSQYRVQSSVVDRVEAHFVDPARDAFARRSFAEGTLAVRVVVAREQVDDAAHLQHAHILCVERQLQSVIHVQLVGLCLCSLFAKIQRTQTNTLARFNALLS